jgi:deoxycytidylate deaminase
MIINAGINRICYASGYVDSMSKEMLKEAGIDIIKINVGPSDVTLKNPE